MQIYCAWRMAQLITLPQGKAEKEVPKPHSSKLCVWETRRYGQVHHSLIESPNEQGCRRLQTLVNG